VLVLLCALSVPGCGSTEKIADQQQKALVSLRSTVIAVGNAWLDRHVSTRYARTALEATATLLEKERAKIGASPDTLVDLRVASLSESQNELARQIAALRKALADSDAAAARQQIAAVSSRQGRLP
jgi:uncharacterized Ntn-hydrolase superfamily protein